MPLIVEDGTGVANAESYVSVEEADAYHASRGNDLWVAILLAKKEQLLRKASDYINITYRGAWIGSAAYNGNLLAWPRNAITPREYGLRDLNVPLEVRYSTAELALIANTIGLFPNPATTRGKKRVKVGPIEVEYDANSSSQTKFVNASLLLAGFLKPIASTNMARLIRA